MLITPRLRIARDITHELHIVRASQNPDEPSTPLPTCQPTTPSDRGSRSVFLLSTDVDTSSNFQLGGLFISPGVTVELLQQYAIRVDIPQLQPLTSLQL
jgi:hypothetical protein